MSKRVPSQKHKSSKHPHHRGVPREPLGPAATVPPKPPVPWWDPSRFLLGERLAANLALLVLIIGVTAQISHFELGRQPALGPSATFVPHNVAYDGNTPPGNGCRGCGKGSGGGGGGGGGGDCGAPCGGSASGGDTGCGDCGSSVAFAGSTNTPPGGGCDIDCGGGGGGCDIDCGSVSAMPATRRNVGFVGYEIAALMPRGEVMVRNVAPVSPGADLLHSPSVAREDTVGHPCGTGNCRSPPIRVTTLDTLSHHGAVHRQEQHSATGLMQFSGIG
jgi:hypothetical protein